MQFYKAKNTSIGQGVEATVVYHKNNGDELIAVKNKLSEFEKQNPKAKAISEEDANKLIAKAKIKLAIPKKKEIRKKQKLNDEQILEEIENPENKTVSILKSEKEEDQILTFIEEVEISNIKEFFEAQEAQNKEPKIENEKEIQETII